MAYSRHPRIVLDDVNNVWAPLTPGPLGVNDHGSPAVHGAMGDTPGPLGVNDHATPRAPTTIKSRTLSIVDEHSSLAELVDSPEVRALLDVIAYAEGADYATMVKGEGSREITDFTKHPNVLVKVNKNLHSTAAGRYQFLFSTWQGLNMTDFSPRSQDIAAIKLLKRRGMLKPLFAGDIEEAIRKGNREWASLPESPYGQPTHSMRELMSVYNRSMTTAK